MRCQSRLQEYSRLLVSDMVTCGCVDNSFQHSLTWVCARGSQGQKLAIMFAILDLKNVRAKLSLVVDYEHCYRLDAKLVATCCPVEG